MNPDSSWLVVERYAAAKSRADVDAALAECTESVALQTHPFRVTATGWQEARVHLDIWFAVFPDYVVELAGHLESKDLVSCWGRASATMRGPFGPIAATGLRFDTPFMCVFEMRKGKIQREQFLFDLADVCRQLDIANEDMQSTLAGLAEMAG